MPLVQADDKPGVVLALFALAVLSIFVGLRLFSKQMPVGTESHACCSSQECAREHMDCLKEHGHAR